MTSHMLQVIATYSLVMINICMLFSARPAQACILEMKPPSPILRPIDTIRRIAQSYTRDQMILLECTTRQTLTV
jgi:hypothetical protein